MGDAMNVEVFYLLEQWARWVRTNDGRPGYKGASWVMFGQYSPGGLPEPRICDEVALRVDASMGLLMRLHKPRGYAVAMYFLCSCENMRALAKQASCSVSTAKANFDAGMCWLDGYFIERNLMAA